MTPEERADIVRILFQAGLDHKAYGGTLENVIRDENDFYFWLNAEAWGTVRLKYPHLTEDDYFVLNLSMIAILTAHLKALENRTAAQDFLLGRFTQLLNKLFDF
jgi:hypothetical protein